MAVNPEQLTARFPGLIIDADSAAHYAGWLEHRLLINRCDICGEYHHPPQAACPACWSFAITPTPVRGTGSVYLKVGLHQGPPAPDVDYAAPYPVAAVDLDEQPGLRFASGVRGVSYADLRNGDRVGVDWIERHGAPFPVFVRERESG